MTLLSGANDNQVNVNYAKYSGISLGPSLSGDVVHAVTMTSGELTHCGLGDFNDILDEYFSSQIQWLMTEIPHVKLPS